jgi:hypothetical protein
MSFILMIISVVISVFIPALNALQTTMHTEQKTIEIALDSTSNDLTKQIDLSTYSIEPPEECALENVSCRESTTVNMKIVKTWEISTVYELTDSRLQPEDFALYYPEIQSTESINRNSDPKQILLLQRALYERGLLPVLPTGRYGVLTEAAVLHFNQIKNITDCSATEVVATPDTIREINAMKQRMADPTYLQTTVAPVFNVSALCAPLQQRAGVLNEFITASNEGRIKQTLVNTSNQRVEMTIDGKPVEKTGLQIDGFVKIEK